MPNDKSASEIQLLNEMHQFLQSAIHDLRAANRRTAIAAELLVQTDNSQERKDLAAQMAEGFAKSEDLLSSIGSYATAVSPGSYKMAVFPSARAVRFALANLDRGIREAGATVNLADLPEIPGDRDRIVELFERLIGNSLKFKGPDAPVVDIAAVRSPDGWVFSVKDNGVGIPAKYRDRLFIPFRRLHGADIPGAGLGLAISRKIVEAHGGRIWIESAEGPGATFCFLLPAADGD
jgi:light-regulated signal transduction histidine kinase (bacteriophytochrome)